MTPTVRYIVAAALLLFAWKGSTLEIPWPPASTTIDTPAPPKELRPWGDPVVPIAKKMLPKDRLYLENLYDAMVYVLLRDGQRPDPIISDTAKFARFHTSTLRLAIDKASVGKYPGLAEAIDEVFFAAAGPEVKPIDDAVRSKLIAACGVLSWTLGVHRDE